MWDLSKHEKLEMEVLEGLNGLKVLGSLVFCGGTMLRLCHELNRYSVDLDFWLVDDEKEKSVFDGIKEFLKAGFRLKSARNLTRAMVFEFAGKGYPRSLKIEIRKKRKDVSHEDMIAFSKHSNKQVMLKTATLEDQMRSKIETFLDRNQIRDAFDIEFLLKKGIGLKAGKKDLLAIKKLVEKFKQKDYTHSLGSLLEFKERQYYKTAHFRYLLGRIERELEEA